MRVIDERLPQEKVAAVRIGNLALTRHGRQDGLDNRRGTCVECAAFLAGRNGQKLYWDNRHMSHNDEVIPPTETNTNPSPMIHRSFGFQSTRDSKRAFIWRTVVLFLLFSPLPTHSAELPPFAGHLHNTVEVGSLDYTCTPPRDDRIECTFIQTRLTRASKPEDIAKALEDAKKSYAEVKNKPLPDRECRTSELMLSVLEERDTLDHATSLAPESVRPEFASTVEKVLRQSTIEKGDTTNSVRLFEQFCRDASEENFLAMARNNNAIRLRTCSVTAHSFKQSFRWVPDASSSSPGTWVVDASPEGPCAIIQLSRFEFELTAGGGGFWRYYAKKIASNPNGELFEGFSCRDFDEQEYLYDWRFPDSAYHGCDYVKFSVF